MNTPKIIDRKVLTIRLTEVADEYSFYIHEWVKRDCPSDSGEVWEKLRQVLKNETGDAYYCINLLIETNLRDRFAYCNGTFGSLDLLNEGF